MSLGFSGIWRILGRTIALCAIGVMTSQAAMADLGAATTRLGVSPGMAMPMAGAETSCRLAIQLAERGAGPLGTAVPAGLMGAIARVESGRADVSGQVAPWPWTVNAEGSGHYYDSKAAAIAAVRQMQTSGMRSIDVGCMQINLIHHPTAFASLEQAFDPVANTAYARAFLGQLFAQYGSWTKATAAYHSTTPDLGDAYARKVAALLPDEQRHIASVSAVSVPSRVADAGGIGGGFAARTVLSQAGLSQAGLSHAGLSHAGLSHAGRPGIPPIPAVGRSLPTYRAAPVPLAFRPPLRHAPG
jgi:hypothetical protein